MGTSAYEKWVQSQSSNSPPPGVEKGSYDDWLRNNDTSKRLQETVGVAEGNSALAARVKDLSERTGLDTGLVRRNPDEVSRRFARANFDPEKFSLQFPKTAEWLARQPENVEIAWEDLHHLTGIEGILERILAGGVAGWKQSKQGRIAHDVKQARGKMTDEQNKDLAALDADIRALPNGRSFYNKAWLEFGRLVGQMAEGFTHEAGEYGVAGATAGVIAGGLLVAAGAPLALFGATVGGGAAVGSMFGWAEYTRQQESGFAYLDLSELRDEAGNPYPEDDIQNASNAVGMANALMEVGATAIEALPFKKAFRTFMRKSVEDALLRPTTARALLEFGKSYTTALGAETLTEVAQEISNVIAEEWVKTGEARLPETPEEREAMIHRLKDIAERTAAGMSIMAFPGAFAHGRAISIEARRADRRAQYFKALGEGVKESGTFKQLPSAMQEIIREQTKDGPLENVYFDAQEWDEYWQSKKEDPASIALRVTGSRVQYDEAQQTSGDVIVPMDKYATILAPTEHNAQLINIIRTAPNQMSVKEAHDALTEAERATAEEDTAQEKQYRGEAEEIITSAMQQMRDAGFPETEVSGYTLLYRQIFSLDPKMSPKELVRRYNLNLSIARITNENTIPSEGTVFTQDDIVKQFMAWKGVSEDTEISQDLRNLAFLRVRDLEPHARAKMQAEIDAANSEYKERTGKDWTYSQPAPRVPAHVVDALNTHIETEKQRLGDESGTNLLDYKYLRYIQHVRELAAYGTGDDLNVFLTQVLAEREKKAFKGGDIASGIFADVPVLKTWHEDFNRPRPKLSLEQSERSRGIHRARNDLVAALDILTKEPSIIISAARNLLAVIENKADLDKNDITILRKWLDTTDWDAASPEEGQRANAVHRLLAEIEQDMTELPFDETDLETLQEWFDEPTEVRIEEREEAAMLLRVINHTPEDLPARWNDLSPTTKEYFTEHAPIFVEFVRRIIHREFFQSARTLLPGFHSKAERLIEQKMPARADVATVRGILKDIKAEERKWLNLDALLDALEGIEKLDQPQTGIGGMLDFVPAVRGGKVDKEYMLAYLRGHRLEIAEGLIETGGEDAREEALQAAENAWVDESIFMLAMGIRDRLIIRQQAHITQKDDGMWSYEFSESNMWEQLVRERLGRAEITDQDISRYVGVHEFDAEHVGPAPVGQGWATKRAAILELTRHIKELIQESEVLQQELYEAVSESEHYLGDVTTEVPYAEWTLPGGENYRVISFTLPNIEFVSHTDEAFQAPNQVAWTRLKDRVGPNGERILFVEEIQSDWHERGREQGYRLSPAELAERNRLADMASEQKLSEEDASRLSELDSRYLDQSVPDAPFRNTWHEFVMKRLIRMAAEQGYDQIAWTTGDQQNERYKLTKVADELRWFDNVFEAYKDGRRVFQATVERKRLAEYVGKELAEKLLSQPPREGRTTVEVLKAMLALDFDLGNTVVQHLQNTYFTGERREVAHEQIDQSNVPPEIRGDMRDLVNEYIETYDKPIGARSLKGDEMIVGGQGMRGFYDDMLVRFANNFGKKYGTKAEQLDVVVAKVSDGLSDTDDVKWDPRGDRIFVRDGMQISPQNGLTLSPALKQAALKNEFTLYQGIDLTDMNVEEWWNALPLDERMDWMQRVGAHESWADFDFDNPFKKSSMTRAKLQVGMEFRQLAFDKWREQVRALPGGGYAQGPLGRIRFGETGVNIELLKNANLSTFFHETGHFFLEVLYAQRDATPELRQMFETIKHWMGKEDDGAFTREQHELWARGFEAYLLEGRAPTAELQSVFIRFKAWLLTVYTSVKELNVELTDEVRGVMDRLIASEQEIEAAKKSQNIAPLFADPELVGKGKWLSPEQAVSYGEAVQRAEAAASEEMAKKIMQDWQREQTRLWKAEMAQVRGEVEKDADDNKVVRARAILSLGQLPSGAELPKGMEAFKLSREAILADYGEQTLKDLPLPLVWTRDEERGLHPDMAADLLGFDSGKALITALLHSTEPSEWIEQQTRERMRGRKSKFPTLGTNLQAEAVKAVHNEKRTQLLLKELDILATQYRAAFKGLIRKATGRVPPIKRVREQAERVIAGKAVRDINPTYYLRAAQKARNKARDALLSGDIAETFAQKLTELLNHELYRAAVQGLDESTRAQRYLSRFDEKRTRSRLGRAGGSYLAQIDAIRERFSFTRLTNKDIDRKQTLAEWVEEQRMLGYDPPIPDKLLYEAFRKNYRELTLDELRNVRDTVKLINHVATTKNKLLTAAKKRRKAEALDEMRASAETNFDMKTEPFDFAPGLAKRFKRGVKGISAAHHKAEFIFEWLDGHVKNGPFWRYLFKPFADAESREVARMRLAVREIRRIFSVYTRVERAAWSFQKQTFEGVGTFNKSSILTLAFNWGNEYNRQAVLEGYGWREDQVQQVLDTLDERDWQVAQQIGDFLETFWPDVAALERKLNGLPPEKVQADAFTTRYGTMRGWYYPIVFDRDLSTKAEALEKSTTVRELFGYLGTHSMTRHGHTEQRIGTGGRPISLSLTGLAQHVGDVVHDLTHREAVIDVMSIIRNPDFKAMVERSAGREMYRQLEPWVRHIAARKTDYLNPIERIISWARQGATIVSLGWKFTTGIAQFLGAMNAMTEIGVVNFSRGMRQVYTKPWRFRRMWEFVTSRSPYMLDRLSGSYDRDVRDALKRINIMGTSPVGAILTPVQDSYYKLIGMMDMGVSLPTWMGAYQAAMDGKVEGLEKGNEQQAIDYGDASVRKTQGSGSAKDLATVQRGPEIYRAFTMFYTFFSGLFNQFSKATNQTRRIRDVPKFVASMALLWFLPAVLQELILGEHPDDDDPEEWLKWLAKTSALYPTQSVILLRDVVNGLEYEYNPSAAFDAFKALTEGAKGVGNIIIGEEPSRFQVKNIINTVGYFGHLPTRQLWLTGEYFHDWWTGDVDADNPADFLWRALVKGVPRE